MSAESIKFENLSPLNLPPGMRREAYFAVAQSILPWEDIQKWDGLVYGVQAIVGPFPSEEYALYHTKNSNTGLGENSRWVIMKAGEPEHITPLDRRSTFILQKAKIEEHEAKERKWKEIEEYIDTLHRDLAISELKKTIEEHEGIVERAKLFLSKYD